METPMMPAGSGTVMVATPRSRPMTCIVGLVHEGAVWMGADSASSNYVGLWTAKTPKMFEKNGILMGFTGSWRAVHLAQHKLEVPDVPWGLEQDDIHHWLVTKFVEALRKCLKEGGVAEEYYGAEYGTHMLIGLQGRMFDISYDYQVTEHHHGYESCGSGSYVALGALYATAGENPKDRIRKALEAAVMHNPFVRAPFRIASSEFDATTGKHKVRWHAKGTL